MAQIETVKFELDKLPPTLFMHNSVDIRVLPPFLVAGEEYPFIGNHSHCVMSLMLSPQKVTVEDVALRDSYFLEGDIYPGGVLSWAYFSKFNGIRHKDLWAKYFYDGVIKFFRQHAPFKIAYISEYWAWGVENYRHYREGLRSGLSTTLAAKRTWGYKHAAKYGYTKIEFLGNADLSAPTYTVNFHK